MHLVLEQALERYSTASGAPRGRGGAGLGDSRGPCCLPHPGWCGAGPGRKGAALGLPVRTSSSPPWLQERTPRKVGQSLVRMGEVTPASSFGRSPHKHVWVREVSSEEVPCAVRGPSCA